MLTGKTLRAIRARRHITQAQLSEASGVPTNAIAEFETGKRDVRARTVIRLCHAMDVKITYTVDSTTIGGP